MTLANHLGNDMEQARAILIFWGASFNDLPDGIFRIWARILVAMFMIFAHFLDQLTGNTNHILWDILHKDKNIKG